jgi:lipopolysaccharide transport system ATP-binding protein
VGKCYRGSAPSASALLRALWRGSDLTAGAGHWAVRGVSFELERGGSLGVIGRNGSGKSSLLRVLAGTARASEGRVDVGVRLASLLDLGAGFHPLETGRRNVEGALALEGGMSRREVARSIREVESFAEVAHYFDQPFRTYSDGMRLRVAFAALTVLEPEVLVTDEILVVGDGPFQERCRRWFDRFLGRGGALVLCSHDLAEVQGRCQRTLWLDAGRVAGLGESREVVRQYRESLGGATDELGAGATHAVGELAMLPFEVADLHLRDERGADVAVLSPHADARVEVDLLGPGGVPQVFVGITRHDLTPVYGVASDMDGAVPEELGAGRWRYRLTFRSLPLTSGRYRLRAHAMDETGTRLYDTVELPFRVDGEVEGEGLVHLAAEWHPKREG